MSSSFNVITTECHHFGDHQGMFEKEAPGATFVGTGHDLKFQVEGIDTRAQAILMFRSFNVNFRTNMLAVNGQVLERAIVRSVEREWKTQMVILPPGLIKLGENEMRIESRNRNGEAEGNLDDFLVTDLVLWFKAG